MGVSSRLFPPHCFMSIRSFLARRGFTLIELLLVIGIIAILASIVIVAINPTKQLGEARNAQRKSDVNTIINAIYQYAIENNGSLPTGISTTAQEVCKAKLPSGAVCTGYLSLRMLSGTYVVDIPSDPSLVTSTGASGYFVKKDSSDRITVNAPKAEQGESISVTR